MPKESLVPAEHIASKIYYVRDHKVMLDSEIALLYQVKTKYLVRAVKRNSERFPDDFAFQLTNQEVANLRCHFGTSSGAHGGRRSWPWVFTEHGILMLSSVLRSKRAALVNVQIMRSFVHLRQMIASHEYLLTRLDELEERYDQNFKEVFKTLRQLVETASSSDKKPIGFKT